MPDLTALIAALKSPKTALAVFLFAMSLLFAPFDWLGITRPPFTTEYNSLFVVILFMSGAILAVEILSMAWSFAKYIYYAKKHKQKVEETFLSLNLEELSVLWAMTKSGTRTIKGSSSNALMLSLRQKGCLNIMSDIQSLNQMHHEMPDDIYKIISDRGYDRMPEEFKNSPDFKEKIREIVAFATDG